MLRSVCILQTMSKVVPLPCVKRVFYEGEDQDGPEMRARYRCRSPSALTCTAAQFSDCRTAPDSCACSQPIIA